MFAFLNEHRPIPSLLESEVLVQFQQAVLQRRANEMRQRDTVAIRRALERFSAVVALACLSSLFILAPKGGRRELVETSYSVYRVPTTVSLPPPVVSTVDSSPALSEDLEAKLNSTNFRIAAVQKKDLKLEEEENRVASHAKELETFVHDELVDFARAVTTMNKEDTDAIDAVVPTKGDDGPEGPAGLDGEDGMDGVDGPAGAQGPPGPRGEDGDAGPRGEEGPEGPKGLEGAAGLQGKPGVPGEMGKTGPSGADGETLGWTPGGVTCPRAETDTMRLVDCSSLACRLETKYNHQWGSVCSRNFGAKNVETICKALGFPGAGSLTKSYMSGLYWSGSKGDVWLTDVSCAGGEGDVGDCAHKGWGVGTCGHAEEAGICCKPVMWGEQAGEKGVRKGPSEGPAGKIV